ncbi:hypothetical protein MKAN_23025 [Mycobacterium kansasii ATCC 12478]|uniref:Uncharacterized protein n=1 Tax=Mycobacterium kansasii ATCC 12478 TaxID=557599 RepID=U5X2J6_MYCKA|nr:hypothetical protein MKAN_23025 [Mycobacterium kansasii ATCC 12478]
MFAVVDDRQDPVELVQDRVEGLPVIGDKALDLPAYRRDVAGDRIQRAALAFQLRKQGVAVSDQPGDLLAALRQHGRGFVGVGQQIS